MNPTELPSTESLEGLKQALATDLPRALPTSPWQGLYRCSAEDFQVEEDLGFEPEGQGEHLFLWVEKTGCNTTYVAESLAKQAGVHPRLVSYSGLKDRHAVTRQWFSVHLPGKPNPEPSALKGEGWQTLLLARHPRKLKRGVHRGNCFQLRLQINNADSTTKDWLNQRWQKILEQGFPNYFGPQRFGHAGQNLDQAWAWLERQGAGRKPSRQKKSLWLSSLRSALFNLWLAEQLQPGSWQQVQLGSHLQLQGSRSQFTATAEEDLDTLQQRVNLGDLHLTGPLLGQGQPPTLAEAAIQEQRFTQTWAMTSSWLRQQGVQQARRPLRVFPQPLAASSPSLSWQAPWLDLRFFLPTGSFATSLLRELLLAEDAQRQPFNQNN